LNNAGVVDDAVRGGTMEHLEVIARLAIRPGELEGFKAQAAEIMRLTRELDTKTLRYDWFIDEDALQCEVHELYESEEGLFEHGMHIMEPRALMFEKYASGHRMSFFGSISPRLAELARTHADESHEYSFFQGLTQPAAV
jgi:quinol monooxygenase YgiN